MCNGQEALKILDEVCERCRDILPISDAWLYGSYARGDYDEESDVDIMLLSPLPSEAIWPRRRRVSAIANAISLKHDVTVSVCIRSEGCFKADSVPYHRNVVNDGIRYAGGVNL